MKARRRDGFALVTAMFVLVALAGAASALLSLAGNQRDAAVGALETARALQAARSGIEWGATRSLRDDVCPATTTLSLTESGLAGFSVVVTCTSGPHTDGAASENVFAIASVAERGVFGTAGYVKRRLRATVTDAP